MVELMRAIKKAGRIQRELAQEAMQFDNAICTYADRQVVRSCESSMELGRTTPILIIFDVAKPRESYVYFLGFSFDWGHRFGENLPSYVQLSHGNCILHLSEHHGDSTPGSRVLIETSDRLAAKKARCARLQVS